MARSLINIFTDRRILLFIPIILSVILFNSTLKYYFFQDDFYEILISRATNINEFLGLFSFLENRSSYRPIGLQLFFFSMHSVFQLNSFYWHLSVLGLFLANYFLVVKVISKIAKNANVGILTGFFWITSSIHFLSLSWLAAAWLIIGNFFFFITSLLFLKYQEDKSKKYYLASMASFLISVGSFEFFAAWPIIFAFITLLIFKEKLVAAALKLLPFFIITLIYLMLRFQFSSLPKIPEYEVSIGLETFKQIFWYALWSLNMPEEIKKQVVSNLIILNPKFFQEYTLLVLLSFASLATITVLGLGLFISGLRSKKLNVNLIIVSIIWFISSISPVLIFPNHAFAMYLTLASIGLYMIISFLLITGANNLVRALAVAVWLVSSFSTLNFYKNNLFIVESQRFAKEFSTNVKAKYPSLPANAILLYPLDDKRHIQAILNENATKVIYGDNSIRTYFDKDRLAEDLTTNKVQGQVFDYSSE